MSDRRLVLSNGRFADRALKGSVSADYFVEPEPQRLSENVWLLDQPDGRRDRQALYGDLISVVEIREAMAFGRLEKNGYVGWVPAASLSPDFETSHGISVRTTWAWPEPDFKLPAVLDLHMTSEVCVTEEHKNWAGIADGTLFVPAKHLAPKGTSQNVVGAARAFLGTPYVWAGNTGFGIDCSGLVEIAYRAAGFSCPPDSDLQETAPGLRLDQGTTLRAGDLIFWKGHVAMATGPDTMIHANAHHMAVVEEEIGPAIARIATTDTGPVTSRLRPAFPALR